MSADREDTEAGRGIGASLPRREDDRLLRGRGKFVGDYRRPGMLEIAFVRSPLAHAEITGITKPDLAESRVFSAADLKRVRGILADCAIPGFRRSIQPVLATDRVLHVGEPIVACLAETRAKAEDLAEQVEVSFKELPAVVEMTTAAEAQPPIHRQWERNAFLESSFENGFAEAIAGAAATVTRTYRTARQCMAPLEGRGCLAEWDRQLEQLTLITSTQMPHILRTGLAECLGLSQAKVRVISPDVGGGFGYKLPVLGEQVVAGFLAMELDRPVRWLEDRREHLMSGANCREHAYEITGYAAEDGELLALDCNAIVDSGAYSAYPFSACLEAAQVTSILPGPYRMRGYRCNAVSVATNKPAILPYRGVARTGVCFALELMMDALAEELGMTPEAIRARNLVRPEEMPFTNITNKYFDGGDYPEALRRAVNAIGADDIRLHQQRMRTSRKRQGVGFAFFCEQGAHGTSVYQAWGVPMIPGFEQATVRMTPDGDLELRVGLHNHGQGMETTLAQIASSETGIDPDRVKVVHGDTQYTPYSTGTWGSRGIVMAGGATGAASAEIAVRLKKIAAHLLQAQPADVVLEGGMARANGAEIPVAEVCKTWYLAPQGLPADVDPRGLEATEGYKPSQDTGTFSYACHAVKVEVDLDLGDVRLLDYVVVEDAGTMINPMIVDGQVIGGTVQGIGTALFEEMPFDVDGQPLATTFADYHLPVAADLPEIRIEHMETPSPLSRFGQKGIGESGAIGPPAAIANAVNDALRDLGARVMEVPLTPERVLEALAEAAPREAAE